MELILGIIFICLAIPLIFSIGFKLLKLFFGIFIILSLVLLFPLGILTIGLVVPILIIGSIIGIVILILKMIFV